MLLVLGSRGKALALCTDETYMKGTRHRPRSDRALGPFIQSIREG